MVFLRFSDVVERISAYLLFECSRREFTIQGLERFPLIEIALEKKTVSHIGIFFKDWENVLKSSCEPIGQEQSLAMWLISRKSSEIVSMCVVLTDEISLVITVNS